MNLEYFENKSKIILPNFNNIFFIDHTKKTKKIYFSHYCEEYDEECDDCIYIKTNNINQYFLFLGEEQDTGIYKTSILYENQDDICEMMGCYACGGCGCVSLILHFEKKDLYVFINDINPRDNGEYLQYIREQFFNEKTFRKILNNFI